MSVEATYTRFTEAGFSPSGKTRVWIVTAKDDATDVLGQVSWIAQWRCYAFLKDNTAFEKTCLRDIANFCELATVAHKKHSEAKQT